MGLFGGRTQAVTDRLVKLAEKTAILTGVSNIQIKEQQAQLLTFKNLAKSADVVGGTFDRASAAVLDMQAANIGGGNAAIALGKALENPIKGITALAKSGVTFTDQEKAKIKTLVESNKMLEAQDLVLKAIEKQVGGTAKATADDTKRMKEAFAQFQQSLGLALLPVLEKITPLLLGMANWAKDNRRPFIIITGLIGGMAAAILAINGALIVANAAMVVWKGIAVVTTAINWALATSYTAVQVSTGIGIGVAIAAAAAFVVITQKMKDAAAAANGYSTAVAGVSEETGIMKNLMDRSRKANEDNTNAEGAAAAAAEKLAKAKAKAAEAARKLNAALKEAKTAIRDDFAKALDAAQNKLRQAQEAFNDFASNVSNALTSSLNFKDAYDAGIETGGGFIAGLTNQAAKIKNFGVLVNRLIAGGLSEQALTRVLDAGVDAGSAIAEELLSGADNILRANELVADVQSIADQLGLNAAKKFYDAGVISGQNLVAGVQAAIDAFEIRLNTPGLSVAGINALRAEFNAGLPGFNGGSAAGQTGGVRDLFLDLNFGDLMGNIPLMANGGIVTSPTLAVIGEAGPEAVVPLDRMGSMGGGINITVNAGLVSSPDQVGQQIIEAIQKAQRRSGTVFAPA